MPPKTEDDERQDLAVEIIDEALDSDELADRLQAVTALMLMDIADSLNVLSQYVELKGKEERPPRAPRARRSAKKEEKEDPDGEEGD